MIGSQEFDTLRKLAFICKILIIKELYFSGNGVAVYEVMYSNLSIRVF